MIRDLIWDFFRKRELLMSVFEEVANVGAASVSIFNDVCCRQLLAEVEARKYAFTPEVREQGNIGAWVYQEVETFVDFPADSEFVLLKDIFEACLSEYAESFSLYPFSFAPVFNAITLARYTAGSIGITPHRDPLRYKNLICIFILGGKGRFFLCADRSGQDAQEIDASAGRVIFLRCPGFMGINKRPFHVLTDIEETRYSFILRQEHA
mgnify:FL=1